MIGNKIPPGKSSFGPQDQNLQEVQKESAPNKNSESDFSSPKSLRKKGVQSSNSLQNTNKD